MRYAIAALLLVGCGDTGQPAIAHGAFGVGAAARTVDVGDHRVTLEVARVAFGPAVFCASRASSDEQCPSALAEVASASVIDALSETPQPLGTVHGFVGTVRSAGYAYGITWLSVQTSPTPTAAAPNRHSAHLEGRVENKTSGATFRFVADVDVVPLNRGQHAVSASGLDTAIDARTKRLEIRLDPSAWLAQVDFAELEAAATATVTLAPDARAAKAIVVGMTSLAPAKFVWSR